MSILQQHKFVGNWGCYDIPQSAVDAYDRVVQRKDGNPDRRFTLGKQLRQWERDVLRAETSHEFACLDRPFVVPEFENVQTRHGNDSG